MNRSTFQHQSVTMPKNFAKGRKSAFHASSGMCICIVFESAEEVPCDVTVRLD